MTPFLMSRDARSVAQSKATKARFTGPAAFPGRATASPANGFSRNMNHESRTFFPPETGFLPRETGSLPPDCDFLPNHNGSKTRNSPQFVGIRRNSSDSDLRPEPLSAHRPHRQHGLSGFHETRNTNHGPTRLPAVRYFFWSEPGPPTMVFTKHETRDTNHGFYAFHESRPLRMAVRFAVGGQESHRQKPSTDRRALRQVTVFQFTIVRRSSLLFAIVRGKILSGASVPSPSTPATRPVRFSRNTRHETRLLWPPGRCFPARCGATVAPLWRGYGAAVARVGRLWRGCGGGAAWAAVERHGRHVAPAPASLPRQRFSVGLTTSPVRWEIPQKCAESRVCGRLHEVCRCPHLPSPCEFVPPRGNAE